ncbi:FAD/NAD(P)-binding domain-containing protein [Zopfia rhizophila CBS 207.26]|uniref:FAD/NAD(P)-binding domain-containing protein n=1 Tax=Zopfia rhizophila CBS 207.26 TaxID=1314779 RepID=A0A6A6DZ64_9PEZI|nr:FAD/NAD(P)-binding domain-containing protein [Zopfia rhizophila CBS 207.26]
MIKSLVLIVLHTLTVHGADPGFPVANPSISYWQTPPNIDVADRQSHQLPVEVDVVIIGSGMTGTSIARHLLNEGRQDQPLRIAMLEARQACSGATGRNGGHIRPSSYSEYAEAKEVVSQAEAAAITRLRAAHVDALISAANELDDAGREAAEARPVDSIDAFFDEGSYIRAAAQLDVLKKEVPDIGSQWTSWGQEDARKISLLPQASGILTGTPKIAGALWPYRFVTHTLKALLDKYPTFSLDTHTPALNISSIDDRSGRTNFEVATPRGIIKTRHIVHAANAWIPHHVPGLDGKISGGRLHMSAQLGGAGLPKAGAWPSYTSNGSLLTGRAWSLFRGNLDYIVQMPKNGEYMFGGGEGLRSGGNGTVSELDDSAPPDHDTASYLNGALPNYFGYANWGTERTDFPQPTDPNVWRGRTKCIWTGIEGGSTDGRPFVGKIPTSATRRQVKNATAGAEWISAAYDGEGMCFAWLCGQALSAMMLDSEAGVKNHSVPDWFPKSLEITEARLRNSNTAKRALRMRRGRMSGFWDRILRE